MSQIILKNLSIGYLISDVLELIIRVIKEPVIYHIFGLGRWMIPGKIRFCIVESVIRNGIGEEYLMMPLNNYKNVGQNI